MKEKRIVVEPEYVYVTIPAEYICVYHRILAMLTDYGEDMLKDCKAACKDRNSGVIECFNMFNAAVAARKLSGNDKESRYWKLAETLIKYVKAKINQIYKGHDNSTSFVFPVDEDGELKAFVSCNDRVKFEIDAKDGMLYEHKFSNMYNEHFKLGPEDEPEDENIEADSSSGSSEDSPLRLVLVPDYHEVGGIVRPCADLQVFYDDVEVDVKDCIVEYYFDNAPVLNFNDVVDVSVGEHKFTVVVTYNHVTEIITKFANYEITNK